MKSYEEYSKEWDTEKAAEDEELKKIGVVRIGGKTYQVKTPTVSSDTAETAGKDILTPGEAGALGVPYGTTKEGAFGKAPMTTDERNKKTQSKKAVDILGQIESYSKKVNTFDAGTMGATRGIVGINKWLGGMLQTDKDSAMLMRQTGKLSNLVRALGEVGALAEGDVERAIKLIPNVWDTKEIAEQNIKDLKEILGNNAGATVQSEIDQTNQAPATDWGNKYNF